MKPFIPCTLEAPVMPAGIAGAAVGSACASAGTYVITVLIVSKLPPKQS